MTDNDKAARDAAFHSWLDKTDVSIQPECEINAWKAGWNAAIAHAEAMHAERVKALVNGLLAINNLAVELDAEANVFDAKLRTVSDTEGTESRKYGIRWGQRDVMRDVYRRLSGLLKWHSCTSEALATYRGKE